MPQTILARGWVCSIRYTPNGRYEMVRFIIWFATLHLLRMRMFANHNSWEICMYTYYIYICYFPLQNPPRRRFKCLFMCQGTFVWKNYFFQNDIKPSFNHTPDSYTCRVWSTFSIAVEKCSRWKLLHSKKNVKGTCLQVTICLDLKKQYSCRTIQYLEKCNTTFNEAQPSSCVSCMTSFWRKDFTSSEQLSWKQGLTLSKKQYSCRNI